MNGGQFFSQDESYRQKLRKPFEDGQIGQLPRVWCKPCSTSASRECQKHPKEKCKGCGSYVSPAHLHLAFVGHAAVTDRLNEAAPDWTFSIEHIDRAPNGDVLGILGNMTIGGKTVPEAGTPDVKSPFGEAMKTAISDFIRRGAMRFGVALDLWTKEVLESTGGEAPPPAAVATDGAKAKGQVSSGAPVPTEPSRVPSVATYSGGAGGAHPPAAGEPKDSGVGGDSPQNARVYGEGTRAGPKAEAAHTGTTEQPALDGSMPPSEAQMDRLMAVYGPRWQFAVLKAAASSYGRSIAVTDLTGAQVEELILAKAGAA